ncbi:hypothetical protein GUJ93_ZPchr0010g8043 [Zizania palustris]|uniref:Uncharacterized protein n=1 Tax=Zizania palustris TaxID=103762 RepID=A0A8J5VVT3_ZIZPA|nr:hypothetical protein GUJ93_ZPchr0010g8043 [Zizania palustris]
MATDSARRFAPTAADSAPTATDPSRHRRPPLRPDYRRLRPPLHPNGRRPLPTPKAATSPRLPPLRLLNIPCSYVGQESQLLLYHPVVKLKY